MLALAAVLALVAVVGVASARAPKPSQHPTAVNDLPPVFNGGFSPKALPRLVRAPISWRFEVDFATPDGSHIPALQEMTTELDRNVALQTVGLPPCRPPMEMEGHTIFELCRESIIGKGRASFEIQFEESKEVVVESPVTVFFAGTKDGVSQLFLHMYITLPVPSSVSASMKLERSGQGPYGLVATTSVPKIAGGAGSIATLDVALHRVYEYKGRRRSLFSARCPNGRFLTRSSVSFVDGTSASEEQKSTCSAKPEPSS